MTTAAAAMSAEMNSADSLKILIPGARGLEKANLLLRLSDELMVGKPDSARICIEQALSIAEKEKGEMEKARAYLGFSAYYYSRHDYVQSLEYVDRTQTALDSVDANVKNSLDWKTVQAKALMRKGHIHTFNLAEYLTAAEYYLQSLKLAQECDIPMVESYSLIGLGFVHRNMEDYDKAMEYFTQAVKASEKLKEKNNLVTVVNEIGNLYMMKADYQKSLEYHFQALEIAKNIGYKEGIGFVTHDIGLVYIERGQLKQALKYLEESLGVDRQMGEPRELAISLTNIARVYADLGDLQTAAARQKESIEAAKAINSRYELQSGYENMALIMSAKSNFKEAFDFLSRANALRDSIFSEQKSKQIAEMEAKYQSEMKEREIELLKKDNSLNELRLRKQRGIIYSSAAGAIVFLLLAAWIYYLYRARVKAHKALQEAHIALEKSNGDLQKALAEVKQLKGLLPICTTCKKIRDDQGYWQVLEEYISEHTEADFSHGICPECAKELYPEYFKGKKE